MLLKRYGENAFNDEEKRPTHEKAIFIDGMPILFLAPIKGLKTFDKYVQFLLKRKVTKYFSQSNEVYICFDDPGIWDFNLKQNVQAKCDSKKKTVLPLKDPEITDSTPVPSTANWTGFLGNRDDKRKLVIYIGKKTFAVEGHHCRRQQSYCWRLFFRK